MTSPLCPDLQAVESLIFEKVKQTVQKDKEDKQYYGVRSDAKIRQSVRERFGRMYKLIAAAVPRANEDMDAAINRLRTDHLLYIKRSEVNVGRQTVRFPSMTGKFLLTTLDLSRKL